MDFVNAMRFEEEQLEWFRGLSEEEQQELLSKATVYDTEMDGPILIGTRANNLDPDAELPFQQNYLPRSNPWMSKNVVGMEN